MMMSVFVQHSRAADALIIADVAMRRAQELLSRLYEDWPLIDILLIVDVLFWLQHAAYRLLN